MPKQMQKTESRELGPLCMRAAFEPATADADKRTVQLNWTTGARVQRYGWDGAYLEELSLDPAHVRMGRLNNGAPLLDTHSMYRLDSVLGVVESAVLNGEGGIAEVRFSKRDDVEPVFQDVLDGILQNVSVGYRVYKYERTEVDGELPILRAIDWEPFELSLVPVGADDGAGIRSAEKSEKNQVEIITRAPQENNMPKENQAAAAATTSAAPAAAEATPAVAAVSQRSEAEIANAGMIQERQRAADIKIAVRAAKLPEAVAEKLITEGVSVDAARKQILDELASKDAETETRNAAPTRVGAGSYDEQSVRAAAIENSLLHRADPGNIKLDEAARQYRGMTLLEMGKDAIEFAGGSARGLSKNEVATLALGIETRAGMHTTSDFPIILGNTVNRTLRRAYELQERTFQPIARRVTLPDYKQVTRSQIGEAPQLKAVLESANYTYGTLGEGSEAYKLVKYGRIVAISREVLINDDLEAFTRLPAAFGASAADLENDIVWGLLTANAAMGDGVALFHASHNNLQTGANSALAELGLTNSRAALRKQTALDGKKILNLQGKYLVVPAALETAAQKNLAAIDPNAVSGANVFAGAYKTIVEPRLDAQSATAWYIFADPNRIDTIEYGYLEGEEGPQTETRYGFEVDGMQVKCRLDFAAKAIDWRGIQKNNGA